MRIATVPATHVYVRHLDDPCAPTVTRLLDPSGDDHRTPCFLDPQWWATRARDLGIDVLHVHFGFEFYPPEQLSEVCTEAHRLGIGIVHTVHDLRNPNHPTSDLHDANLVVWVEHADELVTLTQRTAEEIRVRFGRTATVLPHPHVVPLEELDRRAVTQRRRHADRVRIAVHFKSLRANMFGAELLRSVLRAVEAEPSDVRLRVHLHAEMTDPAGRDHDADLVDLAWRSAARADARMDLHVHHYLSDDELWDLIAGVEVFVLPYRFGTHSGLLEACRDLGTAVVAPSFGGYLEQGAQFGFDVDDRGQLHEPSFATAIRAAVRAPRPQRVSPAWRRQQRLSLAAGHLAVYRRAIDAARSPRPTATAARSRTRKA